MQQASHAHAPPQMRLQRTACTEQHSQSQRTPAVNAQHAVIATKKTQGDSPTSSRMLRTHTYPRREHMPWLPLPKWPRTNVWASSQQQKLLGSRQRTHIHPATAHTPMPLPAQHSTAQRSAEKIHPKPPTDDGIVYVAAQQVKSTPGSTLQAAAPNRRLMP